MPSHYTHLVSADSTHKELKLAGIKVEKGEEGQERMKLVPPECPTCGQRQLPSDARFCYSCGKALTTNSVEEAKRHALLDVRNVLLGDQKILTTLAQEVARVLKRGYVVEGEDVDGVPKLEPL